MNKDIKDLTGAVSVDGDVTPTLREPIHKVIPVEWADMSINDLWDQKNILLNRMSFASSSGHPELIPQIQKGVAMLDQIISSKEVVSSKDSGIF